MADFLPDALNRAVSRLNALDYDGALKVLSEAENVGGSAAELLYGKALALAEMRQKEESSQNLKKCLDIEPGHEGARTLSEELEKYGTTLNAVIIEKYQEIAEARRVGISIDKYLKENPKKGCLTEASQDSIVASDHSLKIYALLGSLLVGKHRLIVTDDGTLLAEQANGMFCFDDQWNEVDTYLAHLPYFVANKEVVSGNCCSLCGPWASNPFHWFFDIIPQAMILEEGGFDGKYLVPDLSPSVVFLLEQLDVPRDRLIERDIPGLAPEVLVFSNYRSASDLKYNSWLISRIEQYTSGAVVDEFANTPISDETVFGMKGSEFSTWLSNSLPPAIEFMQHQLG